MKIRFILLMILSNIFTIITAQNGQFPSYDSTIEVGRIPCGTNQDFIAGLNPSADSERGGPIVVATAQAAFPAGLVENCGVFNLYYEDINSNSNEGFDDPVLGADRRATLCAVYTYIQQVFDFGVLAQPIDIYVALSFSPANPAPGPCANTLAAAGPRYSNPAINYTLPGIYEGNFLDHYINGDPNTNDYDAVLIVNFDNFVFFTINDPINGCAYDLFTILLHEAMHQMGWLSLIAEDGSFLATSSWGNNQFSFYDWLFPHHGDITNPPLDKLITGTITSPVVNPALASTPNILRDALLWTSASGQFTYNQPVYSGSAYPFLAPQYVGSFVSHLDGQYLAYTYKTHLSVGKYPPFVISPAIGVNEFEQQMTIEEIRILLQMGYQLNPVFSASTSINGSDPNGLIISANSHPYTTKQITSNIVVDQQYPDLTQIVDFTIVNNGTPLIIDLNSDPFITDPDNDQISVFPGSLYNIRGCGELNTTTGEHNNHDRLTLLAGGTQIQYIPHPEFIGIAQFGFNLTDGKEEGGFMIYTINVTPPPGFSINPNINTPTGFQELVINGEFENGTEVRSTPTHEFAGSNSLLYNANEGEYFQGYNFFDAHPLHYLNDLWTSESGSIIRGFQKNCGSTGILATFGMNPHAFLNGIFNTPNSNPNPGTNDRYAVLEGDFNFSTLADNLVQCRRYRITFDAYFDNNPIYFPSGTFPVTMQFTNDFQTGFPAFNINFTESFNVIVGAGGWQTVNHDFWYCGTNPSNFINLVVPDATPFQRIFYDNLSIVDLNDNSVMSVNAGPDQQTAGSCQSISLNPIVTNQRCNVTYSWSPSAGLSCTTCPNPVANPSVTTTYTVTVNDECSTVSDMITITVVPLTVTFNPVPNVCDGGPAVDLSPFVSPNPMSGTGIFSGPGISGTFFDPVAAGGPGSYTITYTFTDANGCTNSAQQIINVITCCTAPTIFLPGTYNNLNLTGGSYAIQGNIILTGLCNFTNADIVISDNFSITVDNSAVLNITGTTQMYSCNLMWDGIIVQPQGSLNINGTSVARPVIEDAVAAVTSVNGANIRLMRCDLNRNFIGVDVTSFTGIHPAVIGPDVHFTTLVSLIPTNNILTAALDDPSLGSKTQVGVRATGPGLLNIGVNVPLQSDWNLFQNSQFGIFAREIDLNIQCNRFVSLPGGITPLCTTYPLCPAENGTAIYAATKEKHTVSIGSTPVFFNTFTDCKRGIDIFNYQTVSVLNNNMNASVVSSFIGQRGIHVVNHDPNLSSGMVVKIENNRLRNWNSGIVYAYTNLAFANNTTLVIRNNTITRNLNKAITGITASSLMTITSQSLLGSNTWSIDNNSITRARTGIVATNIQGVNSFISDNTVTINHSIVRTGIRVANCNNMKVFDNTITGTGFTLSAINHRGLWASFSPKCEFQCNRINNTGQSMVFEGNMPTASVFGVAGNRMQNAYYGLVIQNSGVIGQQGTTTAYSDNRWVGTFNGFQTYVINSFFINAGSRFYTRTLPPPFNPITHGALIAGQEYVSGSGFINYSGGTIYSCPITPIGPLLNNPVVKNIAQDNIDYTFFENESRWIGKYGLFKEAEVNPQWLQNEPEVDSFYTASQNGCFRQLEDVTGFIRDTSYNTALSLNSLFIPGNLIEQNYKTYHDVFCRLMKGDTLSAADVQTILEIAEQCPLQGGTVVYLARAMASFIHDTEMEFEDICVDPAQRAFDSNPDEFEITVYPNPGIGVFTFSYSSPVENGYLVITDISGKKTAMVKLNNTSNIQNIDLSHVNSGMYFFQVLSGIDLIASGKLNIIK